MRVPSFVFSFLFFLFMPSLVLACTLALPPHHTTQLRQPLSPALMEATVLAYTNLARCQHGAPPLRAHPALTTAITPHAQWMRAHKTLTHSGQHSMQARLAASGLPYRVGAENLARIHVYGLNPTLPIQVGPGCTLIQQGARKHPHTYGTAAAALITGWMASPGHRRNLLNPTMQAIGVAVAIDPNTPHCGHLYAAQLFAG